MSGFAAMIAATQCYRAHPPAGPKRPKGFGDNNGDWWFVGILFGVVVSVVAVAAMSRWL